MKQVKSTLAPLAGPKAFEAKVRKMPGTGTADKSKSYKKSGQQSFSCGGKVR